MKLNIAMASVSVQLLLAFCTVASAAFSYQKVELSEDDPDKPPASTGHSMVARRNSLWVYGGIIEWYTKQGEKGRIQYGHVLWAFDREDMAWERTLPEGGSAHRKINVNESVEVKTGDFMMRGQVQSERRDDGMVEVKIEQHPGHYTTVAVPPKNLLYYPPAMNMHVAVLSGEKLMYILPGKGKTGKPIMELWAYSFEKEVWTQVHWPHISPEPAPREMHTGVGLGGGMLIYGGNRAKETFDDLWLFSFSRGTWSRIEYAEGSEAPPPLWGPSSVAYDDKMWLFGGHHKDACISSLWSFDWATKLWKKHEREGGSSPSARKGHSAVVYQHCMVIYGGHDSSSSPGFLNDLWVFNFNTDLWKEVDAKNQPSPRNFHKAAMLGSVMYFFGGNNEDGLLDDFWSIDLQGVCD